ncbi:GTP pyrophosphokinase [Aeromonas veronii]
MSHSNLKTQYADGLSRFERLRISVITQIGELLESNDLTLGVPIESRVKSWASIEEKLDRKSIKLNDIRELQDLIGIRIILLFRSDLDAAARVISEAFEVISSEDAGERLGDSRFGYQSQHLIVKVPSAWLQVPTFSSLDDLQVELQIRTLAQHIWAAASHKLQYKNEESVPPPIRRAINRASALLETIDLEFERVLDERRKYVTSEPELTKPKAPLNVDSLALVLSEALPPQNKYIDEDYADLLGDLTALDVVTAQQLRDILALHLKAVLSEDAKAVQQRRLDPLLADTEREERLGRGVYYAHVGLARMALRKEFGDKVLDELYAGKVGSPKRPKSRRTRSLDS